MVNLCGIQWNLRSKSVVIIAFIALSLILQSICISSNLKAFSTYDGWILPLTKSTWILTNESESHLHRFFGSSPFSGDSKRIALLRMPGEELRIPLISSNPNEILVAEVVMMDLETGASKIISETLAWDTQVGAHVQWGGTSRYLYYNDLRLSSDSSQINLVQGVVYDTKTQLKRTLQCPLYHVSSTDHFAVSPNLTRIQFTQIGYGVNIPNASINLRAPHDDGIYITNTRTGHCRLLISLHQLAQTAQLDLLSTPTYGFHTKWSDDGQLILVVMRTLELAAPSSAVLDILSRIVTNGAVKRVRRQHLFVIRADGSQPRHIISWSSKPFYDISTSAALGGNRMRSDIDGNHPQWIPHSHNISMNVKKKSRSVTPENMGTSHSKACKWTLVVFDIDAMIAGSPNRTSNLAAEFPSAQRDMYPCSSGHPIFDPSGRYALLDAYAKERAQFLTEESSKFLDGSVPLRLVDTHLQQEVLLLKVPLDRTDRPTHRKRDRIWRCDMHPAFDRSFEYIAVNARPGGRNRQVMVSRIDRNLSRYFSVV